jgi:hypothetical protein
VCAAAAVLGGAALAAEPPLDLSTERTVDFVALCQRDTVQCHDFIESVMEFFDAASGFNEVQSYRVCAQLPLDAVSDDAIFDWIRTHPDAAPVAADAIGAASEILWPCP